MDTPLEALRNLYRFIPRGLCPSDGPDDCPVCRAREVLTGESQEHRRQALRAERDPHMQEIGRCSD